MVRSFFALAVLALSTGTGCFDDIATRFPEGLEPLEPNEAPRQDDPKPTLEMVDGESDTYMWLHGRGYVFAPSGEVWKAAKDSGVMVHVCATDEQTVEEDVEEGYEYSFGVHYTVETIVTVEWDESWRFGTVEGSYAAPELAIVRYQKTFGSDAIALLEGSVQLHTTDDPGVTEVQFVEHLDAFGGTVDDMRAAMTYRFQALRAALGQADAPTCPE